MDERPICIVQPVVGGATESFIEAHYERLPGPPLRLWGDHFPVFEGPGRPLGGRLRRALVALLARSASLDPVRVGLALARHSPRRARCRALARFLRRRRVGVVLAEYGPTGAAIAESCALAGVPLVVHFHGYDAYTTALLSELEADYRALFARAATVVAVSHDMVRQLRALGAPAERLVYAPYGVNVERFAGAKPDRAPPLFVAVGRFVDKKAPHLTLLAFAQVAHAVSEARLVMLGDGPLREACRQLAATLGVAGRVELRGVSSPAEVADAMRGARCFVQHSLRPASGDAEGTPLAVLEASASALPVVATRHGGIPDVVADGESGFLVAEGDVGAMARRMATLARRPELAARLGEGGRRRVVAEWTIERSIARLAALLAEARRGRPLPQPPPTG